MKISHPNHEMEPLSFPDPMRKHHGELKEALKDFLKAAADTQPHEQLCPLCGQQMAYVDTNFLIYGEDSSWSIRLPVCSCATDRSAAKLPN